MNKIIVANWKMQLLPSEAKKLALSFLKSLVVTKNKIVICPDFLSLVELAPLFKNSSLSLGSQNLAAYDMGAYTGEIPAESLKELGISYAIIGHSERRTYFQEGDKLIAGKIKKALSNKIIPILCVGENAADRKQGRANIVIRQQLKGALSSLSVKELKNLYIAYEPIWAIGSGLTCNLEEALTIKDVICDRCFKLGLKKVKVLYGGSVKPDNAAKFLKKGAFDGLLVGGASLNLESFKKIVNF